MLNTEVKDEAIKVLTDLGFTATQARAYFALCQLGISDAKTISKESKIARQDIYRVLAGLQEMGFVEKGLTDPVTFQPIPLQETIDVLTKRRKERSHELWERTQALLKNLKASDETPEVVGEKPQFLLIPEGRAYVNKVKEAIVAVQSSMDCITSQKRFLQILRFAGEEIAEALRRGVNLRFILDEPINEKQLPRKIQKYRKTALFAIRYFASNSCPQARIAIYDKREVHIAISTNENYLKSSMFLSTCQPLVSVIGNYFETMWTQQSRTYESNTGEMTGEISV